MRKVRKIRHYINSRGYCQIFLGRKYFKMCNKHGKDKKRFIGYRNPTVSSLKIIESFRKLTDDIKVQNHFRIWLK